MAKTSAVNKPLTIVERNLRQHFSQSKIALRTVLAKGHEISLDETWSQETVTAALVGSGCERIARNRGGSDNITDILKVTPDLYAWLGYHESWAFSGMVGGSRSYSFRQLSFSVYLGWKGDAVKPQIFRAEWAGYAEWSKGNLGFQAKNAGHPHWQFDALESVLRKTEADEAELFLELLKEETEEPAAEEFAPQTSDDAIFDIVRAQKMSRMHFASAAAWWLPEAERKHAHNPAGVQQLRDWSTHTLTYILQELGRLKSN